MAFEAVRKRLVQTFSVAAKAEEIFPLLCPVREYDWIPIWDCRMIHSESGVAELDCVFETDLPERGFETWTCYLYEPHKRIGYLRMGDERVSRLEIALREENGATSLRWETTFTGTGPEGNGYIEEMTQARYAADIDTLARLLAHYVTTGAAAEGA